MSVGVRRKRCKTVDDVRAEALIETSLLIVDDVFGIVTALAEKYLRYSGLACRVICASGTPDLKDKLYVGLRQEPGRPPLRGALIDVFLAPRCNPAGETALDVVQWLEDRRYPLLPVIAYTAADDYQIERLCEIRGLTLARPEDRLPRQLVARPNEAARAALRGIIVRPGLRAVAIFDKNRLNDDPEVLRYIEREVFGPWNQHVLAGREFAIHTAGDAAANLTLGRFQTLDAVLSGNLELKDVAHSRGIAEPSANQDLQSLRDTLGRHELLYSRWIHEMRTLLLDPLGGNRWQPVPPEKASPPSCPRARRRP